MPLQDEIDKMRKDIRTSDLKLSIGEWMNLYSGEEVDIHPEFQRFFRWSPSQKTRLIESILLGIPIPPVFVSQRGDGVWDVVDGLQRLSTIFEFAGILVGDEGKLLPPLVLEGTKYLPSLEGKKWQTKDNASDDDENYFTVAQRLYIKRAALAVTIIEKESPELAKYELFQRLNTGGSIAKPQEIRNCIMVMYNKKLYEWMRELSQYEPFRDCIALTDKAIEEQYDLELVLRFIVFRTLSEDGLKKVKDVGNFMTDSMVDIANNPKFDFQEEEQAFKTTFRVLQQFTDDNSFRKYKPAEAKFSGGFLVSPFETIALGIGFNYRKLEQAQINIEELVKSIWSNETYNKYSGSGITAALRLPKIVPLGRKIFKP